MAGDNKTAIYNFFLKIANFPYLGKGEGPKKDEFSFGKISHKLIFFNS